MLTSLSQKIRRILNPSLRASAAAKAPLAPIVAVTPQASVAPAAPALRLVKSSEPAAADRDISIRVAAGSSVGPAVFVAGQGARLYSLDVFRAAKRNGRPGPDSPAAPLNPWAA